jgi:hypothetical protein
LGFSACARACCAAALARERQRREAPSQNAQAYRRAVHNSPASTPVPCPPPPTWPPRRGAVSCAPRSCRRSTVTLARRALPRTVPPGCLVRAYTHVCRHHQASSGLPDTAAGDLHLGADPRGCVHPRTPGGRSTQNGALTCGTTSPNGCGHGGRGRPERARQMPVRSAGGWSRSAGHGCGCTGLGAPRERDSRRVSADRGRSTEPMRTARAEALRLRGSVGPGSARARHARTHARPRGAHPGARRGFALQHAAHASETCLRARTEEAARDDDTAERLMSATMRAAMGAIRPGVRTSAPCRCTPSGLPFVCARRRGKEVTV